MIVFVIIGEVSSSTDAGSAYPLVVDVWALDGGEHLQFVNFSFELNNFNPIFCVTNSLNHFFFLAVISNTVDRNALSLQNVGGGSEGDEAAQAALVGKYGLNGFVVCLNASPVLVGSVFF